MLPACDVFQSYVFTHFAVVQFVFFQYSLKLDDKLVTEAGYCVLTFISPILSEAEVDALTVLSKSMDMEIVDYYTGLTGADQDRLSMHNHTRKTKMENSLALCYEGGDVSKTVKLQTQRIKLPVSNGEQERTFADEWQGGKYNEKAQPGELKLDLNFSVADFTDEEGTVHKDQLMWYLTAEIPLVGGEEKSLKSPGAKKVNSLKAKMAKLKGTI